MYTTLSAQNHNIDIDDDDNAVGTNISYTIKFVGNVI